ncbi:MAG TPA: glycosyltransferase family 39 protein [Xanthobacteraceae bacterium]|nr:glycosyltransferase family 39 protein [Xanthobacteraceae bacterium]
MHRILTIARSRFAPTDILALAIIAALLIIAFCTFDDYGLGWDDYTQSQYGEMLYSYYASGFKDLRAFSFVNLFYYGGGFDLAAHTLGKILPFDAFDTRRLLGAVIGILGLVVVWRTARRLGGPIAGIAALALLAITPLYYGHMFINVKDTPFAVAMVFLLYTFVRAFDEYPRPQVSTILLFGLALGLTIGTRVIGGIAVAFAGIAAAFLLIGEAHAMSLRESVARMAIFAGKMALALPLAYAVMGVIWPWSVLEPLNPIRAVEYFSHFWENPWREMYDGIAVLIPNMPRSYVPKLCLLKFPEIFLGLALSGATGAIVASIRGEVEPKRSASLMLLVSAAVLPIALTVITKPVMYNGIRHFVFVTPPFAILGGLAAAYIYRELESYRHGFATAAAGVFTLLVAWTTVDLVRIHPYQYALFNHLAGGERGAAQRYMTDYWGLAFKETSEALVDQLEAQNAAPPPGRKWKVVVCGPAHTASIELGPNFETTYNANGADFALSLGTFYCAQLDAPVLAETEREGVVFARAYDLRGNSYVTTYAYPPLGATPKDISKADHEIHTFWQ